MSRVLCAPPVRALQALKFMLWAPRSLHLPPGGQARAKTRVEGEEEDDPNRPILFSCSKANPSRWTVEHSLGRDQQRPWWKVLPFSLSLMLLVIWCFLRQETSADGWLRQVLEEEEPEPSFPSEETGTQADHGART